VLPPVAIAAAVLTLPAVGGADATQSAATLRAENAHLAAQSRAAVLGLYALDAQIVRGRARLAGLVRQAAALRAERATLARELRVAQHGTFVAQRELAAQLRTLYAQGNVEPLELVLAAKNITQALDEIDNLNRVSGQSEDVLRQVEAARREVRDASHTLAEQQAALAATTNAARAQQASLETERASRSAYIESLAAQRRLNDRQIVTVVAEAAAAQRRAAELAAASQAQAAAAVAPAPATAVESPPAFAAAPVAAAGVRTITVTATGYALHGRTATGLPAGYGVVAVDPSVIPLGTHMTIPGYGDAVAADTGGAIVGATIDLWFPSVAQADAWGRRTVTVVLH
jgi:cystine transport system substrate-binding protein